MNRYLIIENGVVVNITVWDGESEWTAPDGCTAEIGQDHIGIGWRRINGEWVAPEPPAPKPEDPARVSAREKLAALGLTDEEIGALIR